ncbi:hypothetical protein F0562_008808 [Nyssa sinensis]|uniref:Uncharacterized protein n=1 Tax=Nyssa sinensis TaxID=561372 RepID=A0A5J5A7S8_9ASTE|nr:hypothetical protein F0562_008808 [Nyssa sinensis]
MLRFVTVYLALRLARHFQWHPLCCELGNWLHLFVYKECKLTPTMKLQFCKCLHIWLVFLINRLSGNQDCRTNIVRAELLCLRKCW